EVPQDTRYITGTIFEINATGVGEVAAIRGYPLNLWPVFSLQSPGISTFHFLVCLVTADWQLGTAYWPLETGLKSLFGLSQTWHLYASGRSSNATPGGTLANGSPYFLSYTVRQLVHW